MDSTANDGMSDAIGPAIARAWSACDFRACPSADKAAAGDAELRADGC